jgi:uncharacterized protein YoxC
MVINAAVIVFVVILSIIPALVVAVVLYLRQETVQGDVERMKIKVDTMYRDTNNLLSEYQSLTNKIIENQSETHGLKLRIENVDESFTSLSNKWSSRERTERKERKQEKIDVEETEIPGTEQQALPLDYSRIGIPLDQNPAAATKMQRQFGKFS